MPSCHSASRRCARNRNCRSSQAWSGAVGAKKADGFPATNRLGVGRRKMKWRLRENFHGMKKIRGKELARRTAEEII